MSQDKWQKKFAQDQNNGLVDTQEMEIEADENGEGQGDTGVAVPKADAAAEELEKVRKQLLVVAADYDNYRKRIAKEVEDAHKYAVSKFAQDMVDVLENLYRAETSIKERTSEEVAIQQVLAGVELTIKSFVDMLAKHGIQRILPQGEMFDHNFHEAISKVPSSEHPAGYVVETIRAGYIIHDRLLRPALVVVAEPME